MKFRYAFAAAAAVALTVSGCGGSSSSSDDLAAPAKDTKADLKVWLMDGSQPPSVVDAVNAKFKESYPNVNVKVELQSWSGIQDKLTTSLQSDATPDVVEIGNSLTAKYADAGLLADLTSVADDLGKANWLPGLAPSGELDGSRFGVPYYGGTRIVMYNKAQFKAAGVEVPKTLAELDKVAEKLQEKNKANKDYSAFYFPGKYWYGALSFIWDAGGDIAAKDGDTWVGKLDSSESQKGINTLKELVDNHSKAPKDGDETKNWEVFATGNVGMVMDSWWAPGAVEAKEGANMKGNVGVFPLPGTTADKSAPVFFGGSDLAVGDKSANKGLAVEWMKILTSTEIQTQLAKDGGVIPNQQAAFAGHKGNAFLEAADKAAENSKFTPVSPYWGNVEANAVLPDMFVKIFSGKASVADATKEASAKVADILNGN